MKQGKGIYQDLIRNRRIYFNYRIKKHKSSPKTVFGLHSILTQFFRLRQFLHSNPLDQLSQTRGPRTSRKMDILKEILGQLVYFLKNIGYELKKIFFIFLCGTPGLAFSLKRPARHFEFETPESKHILLCWINIIAKFFDQDSNLETFLLLGLEGKKVVKHCYRAPVHKTFLMLRKFTYFRFLSLFSFNFI